MISIIAWHSTNILIRKLKGMSWIKFVPENLLVILIAIIVSYSAKLDENYHMKILGDMDAKFPVPTFPHFG